MSKKKTKKTILIVIGSIALLVSILCIIYIWQYFYGLRVNREMSGANNTDILTQIEVEPTEEPIPVVTEQGIVTRVVETHIDELPVDFTPLQAENPDIYAWITVPGTMVDYPVVQREGDDKYYMDHGSNGRYYSCGSIFSEQTYNDKSFDEPMTLLYGHNLRTLPTMFTQLNNYIDADFFEENRYFYINMPDKVYKYEIFAAFPNDRYHIMAIRDFTDAEVFEQYFRDIAESGNMNLNLKPELLPVEGDRVVCLSTCYTPSSGMRFLVMGVLTEIMRPETPEVQELG